MINIFLRIYLLTCSGVEIKIPLIIPNKKKTNGKHENGLTYLFLILPNVFRVPVLNNV